MKPRTTLLSLTIGVCATLLAPATFSYAAEQPDKFPLAKDLPEMVRKAKTDFRPLTQTDVQEAKKTLCEALDRLDQRLTLDGPNGDAWRKYIEFTTLQEQLKSDKRPDTGVLIRILGRYAGPYEGLELVWFLDVERSLHSYVAMINAVDNPKVRREFKRRLDKLAPVLKTYLAKPTTEDALLISETVRWLGLSRQTPQLVEAIEHRLVQPNLFAEATAPIVGAGFVEAIDETSCVGDCILGTTVSSTVHTVGASHSALVPNADVGMLDALFCGKAYSDSVGNHGRFTICSTATTCLDGCKRVWMDTAGLSCNSGVSNASTSIQVNDIQSPKGRRMIENAAWKRAGKQQSSAESIASQHAEQKLNERLDQQGAESMDRANTAYHEKFYDPFTNRRLFPQVLHYSTTERAFSVLGVQAGGGKIAAPGAPPAVADEAEMSLRVHESMVNNLAFDALAGRTVHEDRVQATVIDTLGRLPDKMKGDEDNEPWVISFASRKPISVTFADDGFKISIRGVRFYKGGRSCPNMSIAAAYKIEKSPSGFKAIRQGDIQVFPFDFVPGGKIGGKQQVMRKLLEKRFARIFEPEMLGEGFVPPGRWKVTGKLLPIQVESRDGWLTIGWRRETVPPKLAASK
jgi:hypothetical protein